MPTIIIPIRPMPKQSARFSRHGTYQPAKVKKYIEVVKLYARQQYCEKPLDGSIFVSITFCFAMPESWSSKRKLKENGKPRTKRPDLDNLEKPVLDALSGVCWTDDAQVTSKMTEKIWSEQDKIIIGFMNLDA